MLTAKQKQLFEAKYSPEPMSGCWLWVAGASSKYPQFAINRKLHGAHRVSHMLYIGPIPNGMLVCHHCDNPFCVNPAHLFLGTAQDNQQDCVRKGRNAFQTETHPRLKIKEEDKEAICLLGWAGWSKLRIAKLFGVRNAYTIRKVFAEYGIGV